METFSVKSHTANFSYDKVSKESSLNPNKIVISSKRLWQSTRIKLLYC